MYRKILVGYDGSEGAKAAFSHAAILARQLNAQLSALWVHEGTIYHGDPGGLMLDAQRRAEGEFQFSPELKPRLAELARDAGLEIEARFRMSERAAPALIGEIQNGGFDLIVLGQSKHSALWSRLLGHTADRIAHQAPCDVLIVKVPKK